MNSPMTYEQAERCVKAVESMAESFKRVASLAEWAEGVAREKVKEENDLKEHR